jgi:hypothetical protein
MGLPETLSLLSGITLLTGSIAMIVSFFNKHQQEQKSRARAEREKAWHVRDFFFPYHSFLK